MAELPNPALKSFVALIKGDFILAEVLILQQNSGFELRHVNDRATVREKLKAVSLSEVQSIAQFTSTHAFRPLKSSPNLQSGWLLVVKNESELGYALNHFYPNAIADLFAAKNKTPPITNYREFTNRQSGMYRITTMLNDTQAAQIIRACCDKRFCLKQRLWSVEGLAVDSVAEKSLIPCLEPCALLLELARKGMRIEQEEKMNLTFSPSDAASLEAALQIALESPRTDIREADFNSPANPRRLQLALEKLRETGIKLANKPEEE